MNPSNGSTRIRPLLIVAILLVAAALCIASALLLKHHPAESMIAAQDRPEIIAVSAAGDHALALTGNGNVLLAGQKSMDYLQLIQALDFASFADSGRGRVVVVEKSGTVRSNTGNDEFLDNPMDLSSWKNIRTVSVSEMHVAGLKANGTVVARGRNDECDACDVAGWTDIVQIATGTTFTAGLKADGTVELAGFRFGEPDPVDTWTDMAAIDAHGSYIVGVRNDGSVIRNGQVPQGVGDVSDWTDIESVSAGSEMVAGLRSDGTVVVVGDYFHGEGEIASWTHVIDIAAGDDFLLGLRSDGTVLGAGAGFHFNALLMDDVDSWNDRPKSAVDTTGWTAPSTSAIHVEVGFEDIWIPSTSLELSRIRFVRDGDHLTATCDLRNAGLSNYLEYHFLISLRDGQNRPIATVYMSGSDLAPGDVIEQTGNGFVDVAGEEIADTVIHIAESQYRVGTSET